MNPSEHWFFNLADLAGLGRDSIVGKSVRIRRPGRVRIGRHSIIDDFTYISSGLTLGDFSHIGANGVLIGGKAHITLGNFVNVAPGCRLVGASNDFTGGGLVGAAIPEEYAGQTVYGDITLHDHVLLGAGTTVLPGISVPEGVSTGAMTLLTPGVALEPWTVYVGIPARKLRRRDSEEILAGARRVIASLEGAQA